MKAIRFYTSLGLFFALLAFLLLCPLPYTVVAPAIIELRSATARQVFVPDVKEGSQLREIYVVSGQAVKSGDVLAVLENTALRMELVEAEGQYRELEQELKTLETMTLYRSETALQVESQKKWLTAALELLQSTRRDVESLVLRAPIDGVVIPPPWKPYRPLPDYQLPQWWGTPLEPINLNATLESGTVMCSIGDLNLLEAVLIVDQTKTPFLEPNQRVELRLHEFPGLTLTGKVEHVESKPVSALAIQLSTRAGGEVPTATNAEGTEEPTRASYQVRMLLENTPDLSIRIGMTGIGKIHVERQTLGYRLWRLVNETFNFGF